MAAVALGRDFVFKVGLLEVCPSGIAEVDALAGGLPQGGLTEVYGPASSGRTSLMLAAMAQSTHRENVCALVDASDAFDPASAAAVGVRLERLLWVRCGGNAEHALKAADLLVQGGGFGLVVMDLADTPVVTARRISMTSWFRLRRAVEHTPTVLLVVEQQPHAKTCASLTLEMRRERAAWSNANAGETACAIFGHPGLESCPTEQHSCNPAERLGRPPQAEGLPHSLLRLAQEFSPLVEQTAADTVALDADGLERIHGLPQQIAAALARRAVERGLEASVAIAANLDTAVHAARGFAGVSVIPYGDEAKYLGSLPLTLLGPTPEMQETLERWGIRRFRDLAALPELGLAERLGPEGLRLHRLARGAGDRPLVPVREPLHFEEEAELEYPVELLEPLMFVLAQLLSGLRARLAAHG